MIISGRAQPNASVADAGVIYKTFRRLGVGSTLADLASALDFEPYGEFFNTFLFVVKTCVWGNGTHLTINYANAYRSVGCHRTAMFCWSQDKATLL